MKKTKLFFPLLMAIVMMAMSPMKMWADSWYIQVNYSDYQEIDQTLKLSLNVNDEVSLFYEDAESSIHELYPLSTATCEELQYSTDYSSGVITISETGDYIFIVTNKDKSDQTDVMYDPMTGNIESETYSFYYATAELTYHKVSLVEATTATDCSHPGLDEHWECDNNSCSDMWDTFLNPVTENNLKNSIAHDFHNGTCSVCGATDPFHDIITGLEPDIVSKSTYPWAISTVNGYTPGLMSTNTSQDNSYSESSLLFTCGNSSYLSFDYMIDASYSSKLTVLVDGVEKFSTTTSTMPATKHFSTVLSAGQHEVKVKFYVNYTSSSYANRAYLYNIYLCDHSGNTNTGEHTNATCTTGSHDAYTCSVCGADYITSEADDKIPHVYVNGKCVNGCNGMPASMTASSFVDGTAYERTSAGTVGTLTYKRTFVDNDFNCLYVPFEADVTNFTNCDIYVINMFQQHDKDGDGQLDELTLEVVKAASGTVLPNHPYLIKYTGTGTNAEQSFTINNATLAAKATEDYTCSSMNTNYVFKGTYSAIEAAAATAGNYYTMIYDNVNSCVCLGKTTTGVLPQRWYMTKSSRDAQLGTSSSSSSDAPIRIVVAGESAEETTAVENTEAAPEAYKTFENGHMVIICGNKKYNVNGMEIH